MSSGDALGWSQKQSRRSSATRRSLGLSSTAPVAAPKTIGQFWRRKMRGVSGNPFARTQAAIVSGIDGSAAPKTLLGPLPPRKGAKMLTPIRHALAPAHRGHPGGEGGSRQMAMRIERCAAQAPSYTARAPRRARARAMRRLRYASAIASVSRPIAASIARPASMMCHRSTRERAPRRQRFGDSCDIDVAQQPCRWKTSAPASRAQTFATTSFGGVGSR